MIEIRVQKQRAGFSLDIDATLPFDGVAGLIGPSGSGKSTLFSMLAGHIVPDSGVIRVNGRTLFDAAAGIDIPAAQRGIGVVFQDGLLFPHLNVRSNLLFGAPRGALDRLMMLCDALRLDHLLHRRPARLSGGERQRVAIGRALMAQPDLLLLDEPVSALDPSLRDDVLSLLETLHRQSATPMIYISHAPEEIRRMANRVITLKNGAIADIASLETAFPRDSRAGTQAMLRVV